MTKSILQAFRDWNDSSAYLDNNGNYRVRTRGADGYLSPRGKIAPWNKEVKRAFADSGEFHRAARSARRLEPHKFESYYHLTEICQHCDGGQFAECHGNGNNSTTKGVNYRR
jgi:hypothetical protein